MLLKTIRTTAALAAVSLLAACSSMPGMGKPIVQPCPEYFILEEAATLTKFQDGPGRDLIDIEYLSQIRTIAMECVSDIDKDTKTGEMVVRLAPVLGVELGAAFNNQETTIRTFVAVINPEDKILYREQLDVPVSFSGNRTRLVVMAPPTEIVLPINPEIASRYYRVYGGFALTPEQLEYNRKKIEEKLR